MSDYIEREAALLEIEEWADTFCECDYVWPHVWPRVIKSIRKLPTADVRPVMRGKWRFEIGDGKTCVDGWVCSACNCGFHTNVPYFEGFNFCPNCGADMREES